MIDLVRLHTLAEAEGILLSEEMLGQFDRYAELLVEWNEKINLTAITDPEGILVKHFLDSLLLLNAIAIPEQAKLIDVGTGAGFPSLPVRIARPDLQVTLLDSLQKRLTFLQEVTKALTVSAECVHSRAEDGGKLPAYREQYDVATARAVARLRELAEYCLPFVKVGGVFAALKGPEMEEEIEEAKPAIRALGGKIEKVLTYPLPDGSGRTIVLIRKISQTPTKYPRISAKIKKQPIK